MGESVGRSVDIEVRMSEVMRSMRDEGCTTMHEELRAASRRSSRYVYIRSILHRSVYVLRWILGYTLRPAMEMIHGKDIFECLSDIHDFTRNISLHCRIEQTHSNKFMSI